MNHFHCSSVVVSILSKVALSLLPRVLVNTKDFYPDYSQKQPSIVLLIKRCSKNMQQIYRRTPMLKCDFNKVAKL